MTMNELDFVRIHTRRSFLRDVGAGLGTAALAHLLSIEGRTAETGAQLDPLAPRQPHFPGKARNVIFLFMAGAPSQLDLFDPKPALEKWNGQSLPPSMTKDLKLAFIKPTAKLMASNAVFRPRGECGMEISDYLPHIGSIADDICLVRSMYSSSKSPSSIIAIRHSSGCATLMSISCFILVSRTASRRPGWKESCLPPCRSCGCL